MRFSNRRFIRKCQWTRTSAGGKGHRARAASPEPQLSPRGALRPRWPSEISWAMCPSYQLSHGGWTWGTGKAALFTQRQFPGRNQSRVKSSHSREWWDACPSSDGEPRKYAQQWWHRVLRGSMAVWEQPAPAWKILEDHWWGRCPALWVLPSPLHRVPSCPGSCGIRCFLYRSLELTLGGLSLHTLTLAMPPCVLALPYFELHSDATSASPKMQNLTSFWATGISLLWGWLAGSHVSASFDQRRLNSGPGLPSNLLRGKSRFLRLVWVLRSQRLGFPAFCRFTSTGHGHKWESKLRNRWNEERGILFVLLFFFLREIL